MWFTKSKKTPKDNEKPKNKIQVEEQKEDPAFVSVEMKKHGDKNGGHPHVIVDDIEDKHVSVGLTTQMKKGKNNTNYKLETSPLRDGKTSYMRRQGYSCPQKRILRTKGRGNDEKRLSKSKGIRRYRKTKIFK